MKIKVLVENTSIFKDIKSKHGLSVYLETSKHKILFDLGDRLCGLSAGAEIEL